MARTVQRIMTSTFHLEFLSNFNYSGRINYNTTERKQSFAKLKVCSLIIGKCKCNALMSYTAMYHVNGHISSRFWTFFPVIG